MDYETKIAQLLQVAEWRMTYCEVVTSYPTSAKRRDYDPSSDIDSFYKNVGVMAFDNVILILGSLLKEGDTRPISFWNWPEFVSAKSTELRSLKGLFELYGLQTIRDQVAAHQDESHQANIFPDERIKGYIHPQYVEKTQKILLDLIGLFLRFTRESGKPYDPGYFNNRQAREQIMAVLTLAKPTLTDSFTL